MSDYPPGCADDPRAPWNEVTVCVPCPVCNDPVEHSVARGGTTPEPVPCEECEPVECMTCRQPEPKSESSYYREAGEWECWKCRDQRMAERP